MNLKDAIAVSVQEWFALPSSLFIHAWTATGYFGKTEIMDLTGKTEEMLGKERVLYHLMGKTLKMAHCICKYNGVAFYWCLEFV